MPTASQYVGGQLLPIPTAGTDSHLLDPTASALLAYFGHWIKVSLDPKLSEMRGPVSSSAITDACPTGHRFPWDHGGSFMRKHMVSGVATVPLPGLWVWHVDDVPGDKNDGASLFHDTTVRLYHLNWIFPEVEIPDGYLARSGLASAVGRIIVAACDKQRHPTFGYGGDALGTPIASSLGALGVRFLRGKAHKMSSRPSAASVSGIGAEGVATKFFPMYEAHIGVVERVSDWESSSDDANSDWLLTIEHGDSVEDTVPVLERVLEAPAV